MSDTKQPQPLTWVDGLGIAAIALTAIGATIVWGIGWALLILGLTAAAVYLYLEVWLKTPKRSERRR